MKNIPVAVRAACLAAVTICLCLGLLDGRALLKAQFGVGQREAAKTRELIRQEADQTRRELLTEVHTLGTAALAEARYGVDAANSTVRDAVARSDKKVDATLGEVDAWRVTVDKKLDAALALAEPVLQHAGNVAAQVDSAAPLFLDCSFNQDCIFNRYVGVSKAFEKTSQNIDAATGEFRKALPVTLAGWNRIIANSDRTTKATAETMEATALTMNNFARATKPLPTWLRIGLQVAPPVAQAGAAAAAAGVAFGWIKGR